MRYWSVKVCILDSYTFLILRSNYDDEVHLLMCTLMINTFNLHTTLISNHTTIIIALNLNRSVCTRKKMYTTR